MTDYRSRTHKLELHLTYRCDLTCVSCSRASFLRRPHTPDMTLEQAVRAFDACRRLEWEPLVILIGGEPTVHPEFLEFARLAREFVNGHRDPQVPREVHVYSNGYGERARRLCDEACTLYGCSICKDEWKPLGSRVGGEDGQSAWHLGMFVSPLDAGLPWQGPCYCHSSQICGVGTDGSGRFALCATGLSVGALLGDESCSSDNLADMFDATRAEAMTRAMCGHCGFQIYGRGGGEDVRRRFDAYVETCERGHCGTPMSATWRKAFEGRR